MQSINDRINDFWNQVSVGEIKLAIPFKQAEIQVRALAAVHLESGLSLEEAVSAAIQQVISEHQVPVEPPGFRFNRIQYQLDTHEFWAMVLPSWKNKYGTSAACLAASYMNIATLGVLFLGWVLVALVYHSRITLWHEEPNQGK